MMLYLLTHTIIDGGAYGESDYTSVLGVYSSEQLARKDAEVHAKQNLTWARSKSVRCRYQDGRVTELRPELCDLVAELSIESDDDRYEDHRYEIEPHRLDDRSEHSEDYVLVTDIVAEVEHFLQTLTPGEHA